MARKAIDAALDAVPGAVVEAVTSRTAPLSRYSGRTAAGALALSSALTALAQPPRPRPRLRTKYSIGEIAARIDEPEEVVQRWAERGLLGHPSEDGSWSRECSDRAMLLSQAARNGTSDDELERAVHDGRLSLLLLEQVIGGHHVLSAREVAKRAGVPLDDALAIWRALGLPVADPDDAAFTRNEISALRTLQAMRAVFTQADLIEAASVVGRAMSDVGASSVELFRRRLTARFVESGAGELDVAMRLAAVADLLVPPLGPLLEVVLRHHLTAGVRSEAALRIEEAAGMASSQRTLTVAFADLVGFTAISENLSALEVGELASRLLRCAETVLPRHDARIVKSIGDAVMFTARDPLTCCRAATELIDAAAHDAALPAVRAGAAHGPVLRAYADYFGQTVNLASRLCEVAQERTVYMHARDVDVDEQAWRGAGLAVAQTNLRLKGIPERVPVLRVSAATG